MWLRGCRRFRWSPPIGAAGRVEPATREQFEDLWDLRHRQVAVLRRLERVWIDRAVAAGRHWIRVSAARAWGRHAQNKAAEGEEEAHLLHECASPARLRKFKGLAW